MEEAIRAIAGRFQGNPTPQPAESSPAQPQPNISEAASERSVFNWKIQEQTLPLPIIPPELIVDPESEPDRDSSVSILDSKRIESPTFIRGQGIGRPCEWQLHLQQTSTSSENSANAKKQIELVVTFKRSYVPGPDPVWARVAFQIIDVNGNPTGSSEPAANLGITQLVHPQVFAFTLGTKCYLQENREKLFPGGCFYFRILLSIYKDLSRTAALLQGTSSREGEEPPSKRRRLEDSHASDLSCLLGSLVNFWNTRQSSGDVLITCMGESTKAHKFILSGQSKTFMTMFDTQLNTKEKELMKIDVDDINLRIMEALLEFLYLGEISGFEWNNVDHICALIQAADKYWIPQLLTKCYQACIKIMSLENFAKIAKVCFLYPADKTFKDQARHFFECNHVTLTEVESFRNFAHEDFDEFYKLFFHQIV